MNKSNWLIAHPMNEYIRWSEVDPTGQIFDFIGTAGYIHDMQLAMEKEQAYIMLYYKKPARRFDFDNVTNVSFNRQYNVSNYWNIRAHIKRGIGFEERQIYAPRAIDRLSHPDLNSWLFPKGGLYIGPENWWQINIQPKSYETEYYYTLHSTGLYGDYRKTIMRTYIQNPGRQYVVMDLSHHLMKM